MFSHNCSTLPAWSPPDGLNALDVLARAVAVMPWFSRVGGAFTEQCTGAASACSRAFGIEAPSVAPVGSWQRVMRLTEERRCDDATQKVEAAERRRLLDKAGERHGTDLVVAILADVTQIAEDTAHGAAAGAAMRDGVRDGDVVRCAAAASASATSLAGLALAAGETDHRFVLGLRVFGVGRWPVAVRGGTLWVF